MEGQRSLLKYAMSNTQEIELELALSESCKAVKSSLDALIQSLETCL